MYVYENTSGRLGCGRNFNCNFFLFKVEIEIGTKLLN